jgi:hypothetical protein
MTTVIEAALDTLKDVDAAVEEQRRALRYRLLTDREFRAEMEICDRYAIPHSQFLGEWPPVWSELDREKVLALDRLRKETCPDCGTRIEEWDPECGGDHFAYIAEPFRDPGCERIEQTQNQIPDTSKGMRVRLLPRSYVEARDGVKFDGDG